MKTFSRENIIRLLLIFGSLFYLIGIIIIGVISLKSPNTVAVLDANGGPVLNSSGQPVTETAKPPEIPSPLLGLVTAIGTALAIQAGKVLGIPEDKGLERATKISKFNLFINSEIWKRIRKLLNSLWKGFDPDNMPNIATVVYMVGLAIAFMFFLFEGMSSASAEYLLTSWTSLLGFLAGVWSIKTN